MNISSSPTKTTTKTTTGGAGGADAGTGDDDAAPFPSPTSLIEQWKLDAKGAMEDAYANYVLGDDVGESARLVLVATPSDDLNTSSTSTNTATTATSSSGAGLDGSTNNNNNGKLGSRQNNHHHRGGTGGGGVTNNHITSSSIGQSKSKSNNNNMMMMMKYNRKKQNGTSFTSCGVTFCEVNGRAYVCSLDVSSAAYKAGVLPNDCVQYAAVLAKEWEEPLDGDFDAISSQALEREEMGQRITYDELKRVLFQGRTGGLLLGTTPPPPYSCGTNNNSNQYPQQHHHPDPSIWMGPRPVRPVPTTIRIGKVCGPMTGTAAGSTTSMDDYYDVDDDDVRIYDPNNHHRPQENNNMMLMTDMGADANNPRPVVLVFRRTRQRPPRAWNVWPNYRLDDECDVACQILQSLTSSSSHNNAIIGGTVGNGSNRSFHHRRHHHQVSKSKKKKKLISSSSSSPKRRTRGRRKRRTSTKDGDNDDYYSDDDDTSNDLDASATGGADDKDEEDGGHDNDNDSDDDDHDYDDDDDNTNVEASTIRGMIQKAVGLAFIRSNKVVFGVSVHGGSGIVMARLPDGTWSAPSCIGMLGMGLGLQVGLEVANYIFIMQTKDALEHFQRGGSFTLGANVGAAFAGMGREAIGAASVSSALCGISSPVRVVKEDEYTYERDNYTVSYSNKSGKKNGSGGPSGTESVQTRNSGIASVAPIVAYAKSEGLYVGVSLEGSRIFTRSELNARAYKLSNYNHKAVTSFDILTGKILARPPEAESLYALLHNIEFSHEIFSLPSVPRSPVVYNKDGKGDDWTKPWEASSTPVIRIDGGEDGEGGKKNSNKNQRQDFDEFSKRFQHFLFGGITVERIVPHHHGSHKQQQNRQRRTIWVCAPQQGSLRFGFVSKLFSATAKTTNLNTSIIQDIPKNGAGSGRDAASTVSEMDGDEVTLDSALIDNQSLLTTTGTLREKVELSKKLSLDLVDIVTITQELPPNVKLQHSSERRRVICVESTDTQIMFLCRTIEETRILFSGLKVLVEKETSRLGIRGGQGKTYKNGRSIASAMKGKNSKSLSHLQSNRQNSGYASSDIDDTDEPTIQGGHHHNRAPEGLPEGWKSWGRFPGRAYMREQASSNNEGYPTYIHGQLLVRDLCKNVHLPLPLPLCRVLLLDSSSPVISKWENDRGDSDFEKTPWTFPPATPREMEQFQSEHQLIASGSMCGAHRTISYERYRYGQLVRLSETHIVDSDDSEKLAFQVNERLPRRGFSIKVKILLRAIDNGTACEATVLGEIRPVGKNMSDPAAVHKAFVLVLEELRHRYGTEAVGLLAGFKSVVENMPKGEVDGRTSHTSSRYASHRTSWEEKKEYDDGKRPHDKTTVVKFEDVLNADQNMGVADGLDSDFAEERRPSTPSPKDIAEGRYKTRNAKTKPAPLDDTFDTPAAEPVTIEVKPLPKIRLSLMPSPREEDEEDLDEDGEPVSKARKGTSKSKSKRSSWGDSKTKTSSKRERSRKATN